MLERHPGCWRHIQGGVCVSFEFCISVDLALGRPEGSWTAPCGHWKVSTGGTSVFSCSQVGFQVSLNSFQVALEACPPPSHFVLPQPVLVGFVPVWGAVPACDAPLITDVLISSGTSRLIFGQFVVNFLMRMAPPLSVLYSATFYFSINNHPSGPVLESRT